MNQSRISIIIAALATANMLHAAAPAGQEAATPVEAPAKHSFLEPVGDFVNDSIIRPTAPFELVPGKNPNDWEFVVMPYLWAMGLSGKTGVGGLPPMNVNMSSKKILQNLDWAIMGQGEIRKGRWGLMADGYYAALSGSGELGGNLYKSGSLQLQQGLASLALAYRIVDDRRGFLDVYAGARYNYLGIQADLTQDPGGISALGDDIANGVASKISDKIRSLLASDRSLLESSLAGAVESGVSSELLSKHSKSKPTAEHVALLDRLAGPSSRRDRGPDRGPSRDVLRAIDRRELRNVLASAQGNIREYIRAEAAAQVAAANGTLTPEIQARSDAAKNKMAKSISNAVEQSLPTHVAGDQWWIDPIVGLRGQINFTRWLFLAAQGDVGGFGAGSQITYNAQATLGVNFTRNIFGELSYRYMYVDYNKNNFLYQMNTFGLFSSLGFKF